MVCKLLAGYVEKAHNQLTFEILITSVSQEQHVHSAWFLACWCRMKEGKSKLENF